MWIFISLSQTHIHTHTFSTRTNTHTLTFSAHTHSHTLTFSTRTNTHTLSTNTQTSTHAQTHTLRLIFLHNFPLLAWRLPSLSKPHKLIFTLSSLSHSHSLSFSLNFSLVLMKCFFVSLVLAIYERHNRNRELMISLLPHFRLVKN